ncbi:MAG: low specificity L-threonine aldolase, partial [Paenibacillus macerans]|nr:low specificity L-threonine aldolase [Paenibacillus macerans]
EEVLVEICGETGVGFSHYVKERTAGGSYFEVSIGDRYDAVPGDKLLQAFELLDEKLKGETEF